MAGKRSNEGATYVTRRALYRKDIKTVSETDPTSDTIPVLNTEGPPNTGVGLGQNDYNQYGKDARIFLAVFLKGYTSATIDLWMRCNVDTIGLAPEPSSSSSSEFPSSDEWVKVASNTVTSNALLKYLDI